MSDEKFAGLIKNELDNASEMNADITRRLRLQRQAALDKLESKPAHDWFKSWRMPLATAAVLLVGLLVVLPQEQREVLEIATLPAEDLEIISTMDFEELDNLDFYHWLDMQEGQAG